MQTINTSIVKSLLFTAAFSLVTTCASATTLRVNLPVAARLGQTVLPAGDYTLEYKQGSPAMRVSGAGKAVTVLVEGTSTAPNNTSSHLRLVDVAGTPSISSFHSAATGTTYFFPVSKEAQVENKNVKPEAPTAVVSEHGTK